MRYTKKNIKHKGKKDKKGKKSQTRKISKSIKGLNTRIKQIVKKITGKPFRGTIGVVSKFVLKETTPYLGKIPIAFDHGGASETIIDGKNGFLATPVKIKSLSEKINLALSLKTSKREKMGEISKKIVSKKFSHEKMCNLTLSLYKQCLVEYKRKS